MLLKQTMYGHVFVGVKITANWFFRLYCCLVVLAFDFKKFMFVLATVVLGFGYIRI